MRGEQVRFKRRLESLQKAVANGDSGAEGEARLLATWLSNEQAIFEKRQDDRCKVIVGALVGAALTAGHKIVLNDKTDLLNALDSFLLRPAEREAILGSNGKGSNAFHRVFGSLAAAD